MPERHGFAPYPPADIAQDPLVRRAAAFARDAHAGQTRRHGAPYVTHVSAVAHLAQHLLPLLGVPVRPALLAAAWLHDVIEDSPATRDTLAAAFGAEIADLVAALSKADTTGADAATKLAVTDAYYAGIAKAGPACAALKLCDRLHNLSELRRGGLDRVDKYVTETRRVLPALTCALGPGGPLAALWVNSLLYAVGDAALPSRGLYALLSPGPDDTVEDTLADIAALDDVGVPVVQLRCKALDGGQVLAHAQAAVRASRGIRVVVNDRADVAFAADAHGVHVGQTDLPPAAVHAQAKHAGRDGFFVGRSTHTPVHLAEADADDAVDWLAVGPVFASPTKVGHADTVGLDGVRAWRAGTRKPLVAIGGLTTPDRLTAVCAAGADLAAVVSALQSGPDLRLAALTLHLAALAGVHARGVG